MRCASYAASALSNSAPPVTPQRSRSFHWPRWRGAIVLACSIHTVEEWPMPQNDLMARSIPSSRREPQEETSMNQHSMTVRGTDRYNFGVMEYKRMGYWEPDYELKATD